MARKAGALLIFDELITGYRYPGGSVQKARGVTPDLACLGKAIASGMPLSALVGKADLLQRGLPNVHYGPTFKAESYSFVAAKASIEVCRREPVARYVWTYGERLREGIRRLCSETGVAAEIKGLPFRMSFHFRETDPERLLKKRTLFQQELLRAGVSTYNGVMLPSYAHDDVALEQTLDRTGKALEVVAMADRTEDWDRYLEIPLWNNH
jgi:glutamate-1-semialdehyde aminotransferase